MKKQITLLSILIIGSLALRAQLTFQRAIGTPGNDRDYSLAKTNDGGYITAGYTEHFSNTLDIYVVKTDAYGNVEWSKTIGNSENQRAWQLIADSRGGYVLAGATTVNNSTDQAFLIRLNGLGDIDWQLFLDASEDLSFYGLKETRSGHFIAAGLRRTFTSERDMYIAKVSPNGTLVFANSYEINGNQQLFNLIEDDNRHIVAAGWFRSSATNDFDRVVISKFDSSGTHLNTLTTAVLVGTDPIHTRGYDLIQSGRHYYVVGWTNMALLQKVDTAFTNARFTQNFAAGNTLWSIPSANNVFDIKEGLDNNLMLAGYTQFNSSAERDAWLMKITKSGQVLWGRNYGGSNVDGHWPTEVIVEADRTFTLLSSTNTFGQNSSYDMYLVKTDGDGRSSCNTSNTNNTINNNQSLVNAFFDPVTTATGSVTSLSFTAQSRTSDVQKLCCKLTAIASGSRNVCRQSTVQLGADSMQGYLYEWSRNGIVFSRQANPSLFIDDQFTTGTYKLKVYTPEVTCAPDSVSFTLTLNTRPARNFPTTKDMCIGDTLLLVAPFGSNTHFWQGPQNFTSTASTILALQPGLYTLDFRAGACDYRDSIQVSFNPNPVVKINDTGFCAGSFVQITAPSGFVSYQWNNDPAGLDTSRVFQNAGTVILKVVNTFNCSAQDTFQLIHYPVPPPFTIQAPDSACDNAPLFIEGPVYPNHHYNWNNGEALQRNIFADAGKTYTLVITNNEGCSRTNSFFMHPKPSPSAISDQQLLFCEEGEIVVDADSLLTFKWNGMPGNERYTYEGIDTVLLVRTNSSQCDAKTYFYIQNRPVPRFSLGNDTLICEGDSVLLEGPENMMLYGWNTLDSTESLWATQQGVYWLSVMSFNGCTFADTITIDTEICDHGNVQQITAAKRLSVFPNPSQDNFNIILPPAIQDLQLHIQLFDALGRQVPLPTISNTPQSLSLDGSTLSSGTYRLIINQYWTALLVKS